MSRGGARPGAGRKGLSNYEKLLIGASCESRWQAIAEKQAIERHNALPKSRDVLAEQERAHLIPVRRRRSAAESVADISEAIDEITGGQRAIQIPIKRPYGSRAAVIAAIQAELLKEYGRTVSVSQITEAWKEWAKFKKSPEYRASLKSP